MECGKDRSDFSNGCNTSPARSAEVPGLQPTALGQYPSGDDLAKVTMRHGRVTGHRGKPPSEPGSAASTP